MSAEPSLLQLVFTVVACGDQLRGRVDCSRLPQPVRADLVVVLSSGEPHQVAVASHHLDLMSDMWADVILEVPIDGPVTLKGQRLAVSWKVVVAAQSGDPIEEIPVVVTPRGGVALWLQRHGLPPSSS